MAIDTSEPDSPGWWLLKLARKLEARTPRLQELDDRMRGNAPLPHVSDNVREVYRRFQRKSRTNWAELVIESARDRMTHTGFRTAATPADEDADARAMEIYNANGLAIEAADIHESFLGLGDAYAIVGEDDDGAPLITGEDPRQVVTIHDPQRQRQIRAGAKFFHDDDLQRDYAYLYLPGRLYIATRDVRRTASNPRVRFNASSWNWDDDRGGDEGESLGIPGRMPVHRLRNRRGVGDFEQHTDLLDRIDHQVLQRMVIATMQAFRQRAVKGLPDEDDEGNPIDWEDVFVADPGALWKVPESVEFWESGQGDIGPILESVKEDVRELSAVTRTPIASLLPDGANQSAEGAAFHREALVLRVEDRITRAGEFWCDLMSSALRIAGEEDRADRSKLTALWKPADRLSLAERADAAAKAREDLPLRWRLEHIWQFTPTQVDEIMQDRVAEQLLTVPDEPSTDTAA